MNFSVSRLGPDQVAAYRALRLSALESNPESFGASFTEEASLSDDEWGQRVSEGMLFGAWTEGALVGCVGLALRAKVKLRHKVILWGMFVDPDRRALGIGKRLLDASLSHARGQFEEVILTVVAENDVAIRLYVGAGFREYGRESRDIKIDDRYYDEILMRLPLPQDR
ncbi:GNAT family N-acetyltransferase [Sphingomicrobium sp. XHP0239]|uniref:GNAT family N-acetyltransferase n=1 Tax=Sphingomicrobium maritimum TaxID=3133972 RepID=UPI0031CC5E3D